MAPFRSHALVWTLSIASLLMAPHSASASGPTVLVDNYTPEPGTSRNFFLLGTHPTIWSGTVGGVRVAQVAFFNLASDNSRDVWTMKADGTGLTKVLTLQTPVPGTNLHFCVGGDDIVQIASGRVVFQGAICEPSVSLIGIYTVPVGGGDIKTLASNLDPLQGFARGDFHARTGIVVYQQQQRVKAVGIYGGPITTVASVEKDSLYTPPQPYCCTFDTPDVAGKTVVVHTGNVFGNASIDTVNKAGDPLSFAAVANTSTGFNSTNVGGAAVQNPTIDGTTVLFRGSNLNPPIIDGIWAAKLSVFTELAGTNTPIPEPIPGGSSNFLNTGFDQFVAAGGSVAFRGAIGNDCCSVFHGLYVVRENGKNLAKIIAKGDQISNGFNVFTVQDVAISREAMTSTIDAAGKRVLKLVFFVAYATGFGGIYEIDLSP